MIFFGHLGITTGVIKTYEKVSKKDKDLSHGMDIDYRVVLVGSFLPDIIDKPIGAVLFRSTFHNSRIFAHTLVFSILFLIAGIYMVYTRRKTNVLLIGICCLIHLILDSMWLYPAILFWPFYGWEFPVRPEGNWLASDFTRLFTDPSYYLPEIIGFIILAYSFVKLIRNKQLKNFIKEGKL
jgi:inner membrane protein